MWLPLLIARAADPCDAPTDPGAWVGCVEAARTPEQVAALSVALSELDGRARARAVEALSARVWVGSARARGAILSLLVGSGALSARAAEQLPPPEAVRAQLQAIVWAQDGWPERTPVEAGACVLTGEPRPGVLALACGIHACGGSCMAYHLQIEAELGAGGWRTLALHSQAGDDGSCGCCMLAE